MSPGKDLMQILTGNIPSKLTEQLCAPEDGVLLLPELRPPEFRPKLGYVKVIFHSSGDILPDRGW